MSWHHQKAATLTWKQHISHFAEMRKAANSPLETEGFRRQNEATKEAREESMLRKIIRKKSEVERGKRTWM